MGWAPSERARIELVFTLFDCNNNGSISQDELVILLQSAMAAVVKLTGAGVVPGGDEIEAALTALKSDVDEVGAGLEVDANEVKARIVEGVQLLLPLCSFLAPSIRGAA